MRTILLIGLLLTAVLLGACSTELTHAEDDDHDHDGDGVQDHAAEDHDEEHDEEHADEHNETA